MSKEDRKYLRFLRNGRPGIEVFARMVEVLTRAQNRTDQLLNRTKDFLLETYRPA